MESCPEPLSRDGVAVHKFFPTVESFFKRWPPEYIRMIERERSRGTQPHEATLCWTTPSNGVPRMTVQPDCMRTNRPTRADAPMAAATRRSSERRGGAGAPTIHRHRVAVIRIPAKRHDLCRRMRDQLRGGRKPHDRVIKAADFAIHHRLPIHVSDAMFDETSVYYMPSVVTHISAVPGFKENIIATVEVARELAAAAS